MAAFPSMSHQHYNYYCYYSLVLALAFLLFHCHVCTVESGQIPAMFVFGDSLVDDGNNNYLSSLAKANYEPYGIDFFQGPTGRFSNGKTIVDIFCDMLGLAYLPAYSTPGLGGRALLGGVNYASAAGGIMDESGQHLGERYSLSRQVLNFESQLSDMRAAAGGQEGLNQLLARSVAVVVIGSNDYLNNYLLPSIYPSSYLYTPDQYASVLVNRLTQQLVALHSLGMRKFFLAGVGPLGCIPNQRASGAAPPDRCVDGVNQMVGFFNRGLTALVDQLNSNHPGAVFAYGNTYGAMGDLLNNPATYGFRVIDSGCCGVGRNRGEMTCLPFQTPCANRDEYAFWDAFHPTQAVNTILAQRAFNGPTSDCHPINMRQMVVF